MKPALLLDMDNVLVDTRPSFDAAVLETVRAFSGTLPEAAEVETLRAGGGLNNDWDLTEALLARRGIRVGRVELVRRFDAAYWGDPPGTGGSGQERWIPAPGLLDRLATRFRLGIVTGRSRREAAFALARAGAAARFAAVVTADDVRFGKPDPEGVRQALATLEAASGWYAGDMPDDRLAAEAGGLAFVAVLPPGGGGAGRWRDFGGPVIDSINRIEEVLP